MSAALAGGSLKPATQSREEIAPEFRWNFTPIYPNRSEHGRQRSNIQSICQTPTLHIRLANKQSSIAW
jgi:hypothetical protein